MLLSHRIAAISLALVAVLVGACSCEEIPVCRGKLCTRLVEYLGNPEPDVFPQNTVTKKVLETLAEIYWDLEPVATDQGIDGQAQRPQYNKIANLIEQDELTKEVAVNPRPLDEPKCDAESRRERLLLMNRYIARPVLKAYLASAFDRQAKYCAHNSIERTLESILEGGNLIWTKLFGALKYMTACDFEYRLLVSTTEKDGSLPKCFIDGLATWLYRDQEKPVPSKSGKFEKYFRDNLEPLFVAIPDTVYKMMDEYHYWTVYSPNAHLVLNLSSRFEYTIQLASIGKNFVGKLDANQRALQKALQKMDSFPGKLKAFGQRSRNRAKSSQA